ncbi:MAG: Thioredoxin reductase [Parcubacteria group bacterium GW2011_GWA2_38_13]|nr:MAG: Thioredoxin reductase [Parcubacteria group bacterium GW2011_GWA2_38_13]
MHKDTPYDVIIIGSGPGGYTAAIYASRGNLKTLEFTGSEPGGQLMITSEIENFPGFRDGIQGPELMKQMEEQAKKFGTQIIHALAEKVDFTKKILEIVSEGKTYYAKTCIISTGARAQWLGIVSEIRLKGRGISACATCDGFFFKNKDIIVVGGGDTAMEEALYLTKFVQSIKILVRKDASRASAIMQKRANENPKIEFLFNTEVKEFLGKDKLEGVKIINNKTNEIKDVKIEGAFIAIGHKPNTEIFQGQIELDLNGYIVRKIHSQTSDERVFVAGDVHDHRYRQAVTAAGYGCEAAIDALKYLDERKEL